MCLDFLDSSDCDCHFHFLFSRIFITRTTVEFILNFDWLHTNFLQFFHGGSQSLGPSCQLFCSFRRLVFGLFDGFFFAFFLVSSWGNFQLVCSLFFFSWKETVPPRQHPWNPNLYFLPPFCSFSLYFEDSQARCLFCRQILSNYLHCPFWNPLDSFYLSL